MHMLLGCSEARQWLFVISTATWRHNKLHAVCVDVVMVWPTNETLLDSPHPRPPTPFILT